MIFNWEPIKSWFGFTRRERRSTFILLLIITGILILRYAMPSGSIDIEDISASFMDSDIYSASLKPEYKSEANFSTVSGPGNRVPGLAKGIKGHMTGRAETFAYPQEKSYSASKVKSQIELNSSDSAALVSLPGIGPVLSVRIIRYRHLLGGFAHIDQLKEVYGLPEETFNLIKARLYIDSTLLTRININSAGYKELLHIHYLEQYDVKAILKYRELKGRINSMDDLTENKVLTVEKASKVGSYLKYDE